MVTAIIVAGGRGKRMGQSLNKQFIKIGGREILARTLEVFQNTAEIDEIVVVCAEDEIDFCRENIIEKYSYNKVACLVAGGQERQNSVLNGLRKCGNNTDIVVIHDGARPFITSEIVRESIECAVRDGACTAAVPVKDTIKVADMDGFVEDTPDRQRLFAVQTPQTFRFDLIYSPI
jgi:2-C-methyl-D-erythritol 4-phosphate cytidylyltransferase